MKNIILYILSISLIIIILFNFKKKISATDTETKITQIELNSAPFIKAELEVLNGCGESGIANLYTNYLRKNNFDVIEVKNADNFNYNVTTILIHKSDKLEIAKELANILSIDIVNIKIDKNNIWDLSIIIGSDYKELTSFKNINKYYDPY